MLKLKVNGHYLELPEDIQINLTIENPLMLADIIPSPYSLTFDLPPTPKNLLVLKFPNRVNSINSFKEYSCSMEFGALVLMSGVIMVTESSTVIKANFRATDYTDAIFQKMYNIPLQQYNLGRGDSVFKKWFTVGGYGYNLKQLVNRATNNLENFVVAPVRIAGQSDELDGRSMARDNYFNFYNPRDHEFGFTPEFPRIYPMPKLSYVVSQLFGGILDGNPFASGDLAKLVMVTSYHPKYPKSILLDNDFPPIPQMLDGSGNPRRILESDITEAMKADTYFRLNSYMADVQANEFLKSLMKLFCISLYPQFGKFKIVENKSIMNGTRVENFDHRLIGDLIITKAEKQEYTYGYADQESEADGLSGITLNTIEDLIKENAESTVDGGATFYIQTTGQYFKKTIDEELESTTYELLNSGLGGKKDGENKFDMTSDITPLRMNLHKYWWDWRYSGDALEKKDFYVPEWNGTRQERPQLPNIMFYYGVKGTFTSGDNYPFITSHNYDHFGMRLGDTSLCWDGSDGLLANYHSEYKAWIEKEKKRISGTFFLSGLDLKNLDLTTKKNVKGKLFFIEKINVTIRKDKIDPAQIDLLEA